MYSVLYHSKQGQGSKIQKSTAQKAKEAVESEKKKQAEAKKKQAVERGEKKQTAKKAEAVWFEIVTSWKEIQLLNQEKEEFIPNREHFKVYINNIINCQYGQLSFQIA